MRNKPITPAVLDALNRWYTAEKLSQEQIARIAGVNRSGQHQIDIHNEHVTYKKRKGGQHCYE